MKLRNLLKFLALMAYEVIVGLFLFLILPGWGGFRIPLWAGLLVIAVLVAKDFLIAPPFVLGGGVDKRPAVGSEGLVGGRTAVVVEDLSPEGVVKVGGGELWRAECLNGKAKRGS